MPTFTTTTAFDMHNLPPVYLPVDDATASRVLDVHLDSYMLDQNYATGWTIYSGSFSYDANDNIFGTVTAMTISSGTFRANSNGTFSLSGSVQQSLTGLNKSASMLASFYAAEDVQGLAAYLFDGNDQLTGSAFNDVLDGFAGNDTMFGGAGADELWGGAGDDILLGGISTVVADTALDKLYGGADNDLLRQLGGIIGGEVFDGGAGTDTIELLPSLTPSSGPNGPQTLHDFTGATLVSIERLDIKSTAGSQSWVNLNFSQIGTGLSATAAIIGGAGQDIVALLAGSAGTYTVPSFARTNWTTPVNSGDPYDAVLLQASGAGDFTLKASQGHTGVEILTGAGGDDTFHGSNGIEIINGGAGDDTIIGSAGNDRIFGGAGRDTFDYSAGFTGFAAGTLIKIDGGDHPDGPSVATPIMPDELILKGKSNDFVISTSAGGTTVFDSVRGITFETTGIEKLSFTEGVSNSVTAVSTVSEMARLALDAYTYNSAGRNWLPLTAIELGILPASPSGNNLIYTMSEGVYRATQDSIGPDAEAVALVSVGMLGGQRVLSISFRGTDFTNGGSFTIGDLVDDADFPAHYAKFEPLIKAIDDFVNDPGNQIQKVLVSGHSLGAAMTQMFLDNHANAAIYQGVALATPSTSANNSPDLGNILNLVHSDDPVTRFFPNPHNGAVIKINTPAFSLNTKAEHGADLYFANLIDLITHAKEAGSPFSTSALGLALASGSIYGGADVQISLSDNENVANLTMETFSGDNFVLGSGAANKIYWKDIDVTLDNRVIDAGGGLDELRLPGTAADWVWPTVAGQHGISYQNILVGQIWNVEKLVFTGGSTSALSANLQVRAAMAQGSFVPVVYLDGSAAVVQTAPSTGSVLTVNAATDYVLTGIANLTIEGSIDDDIIMLEGGKQVVNAGAGDDIVNARTAVSGATFTVTGGAGNDLIFGGQGSTLIAVYSGALADYRGQQYADGSLLLADLRSQTPDGADTLTEVQTLRFADGDIDLAAYLAAYVPVTMTGSAASDSLSATPGRAADMSGLGGNDTLVGSNYGDTIDGGSGNDAMYGGAGNDLYIVDSQSDLIFESAGEGTDSAVSTASFYLYANVENLTLAAGAGDLFGVGNELANVLTGNDGANLLIGWSGDDKLAGGAGNDLLYGVDGTDSINGEAGIDYLVGGTGNDILNGGDDADALYGEDGDDVLIGGASFHTDILVGGAGNDVLNGQSGQANPDYDEMDGGAGDDSYYVDTGADLTYEAVGGGIDTVYANVTVPNAGVYLYANLENLVLQGTTAFGVGNGLDNTLTGSAAGNWLLGGAGVDTLNGKAGNDVLFGEGGVDTFVFEAGTGADVIGDFQAGTDKISLVGYGLTFAQWQGKFVQNGNVGAIDLGNGDIVVLHNVTMANLTASDFVFG